MCVHKRRGKAKSERRKIFCRVSQSIEGFLNNEKVENHKNISIIWLHFSLNAAFDDEWNCNPR